MTTRAQLVECGKTRKNGKKQLTTGSRPTFVLSCSNLNPAILWSGLKSPGQVSPRLSEDASKDCAHGWPWARPARWGSTRENGAHYCPILQTGQLRPAETQAASATGGSRSGCTHLGSGDGEQSSALARKRPQLVPASTLAGRPSSPRCFSQIHVIFYNEGNVSGQHTGFGGETSRKKAGTTPPPLPVHAPGPRALCWAASGSQRAARLPNTVLLPGNWNRRCCRGV